MQKKGQAAMEFLMTYGWAILAAIIAIGVLAYFGVFSPGQYVTGSAIVNPPFYANAWAVSETGGVTVELRNNGGETYNITAVDITVNSPSGATCTGITPGTDLDAGALQQFTLSCSGISEGDSFKGDITIQYTKEGSGVTLSSTGSIAEKVTA